jgi:hypothetical protein
MTYFDEDGYDPADPDAPQEIDLQRGDDDEETRMCPNCGKILHYSADKCSGCGFYLMPGEHDSPAAQRARGWFWPVMVALLIAVILVLWMGFR